MVKPSQFEPKFELSQPEPNVESSRSRSNVVLSQPSQKLSRVSLDQRSSLVDQAKGQVENARTQSHLEPKIEPDQPGLNVKLSLPRHSRAKSTWAKVESSQPRLIVELSQPRPSVKSSRVQLSIESGSAKYRAKLTEFKI